MRHSFAAYAHRHIESVDRESHGGKVTLMTLADFPVNLDKKITLLKYFRNYMTEHLLNVSATMGPAPGPTVSDCNLQSPRDSLPARCLAFAPHNSTHARHPHRRLWLQPHIKLRCLIVLLSLALGVYHHLRAPTRTRQPEAPATKLGFPL